MAEPASFGVRTVLLTTEAAGRIFTYTIELARELTRAGTYVVLACMGPPLSATQRRAALAISGLELWENKLRLEWMSDPWHDVARAGEWLLALEERVRPDVVHLNQYAYGDLAFSAPTLVVAHGCLCGRFRSVHGIEAPPEYDGYRRRIAAGLAGADGVVAPTRAMLEAITDEYGPAPSGQIRAVIFYGRQSGLLHPARPKEAMVLSVGRLWDEAKNVGMLVRAAADLSWPVVVGGGLEREASGPASLGGVHATGPLDEATLADWFARASIFALPARYEPFGYTAVEAALSGCALVLGDIASLREIWQEAAFYASPDDPEEIAGIIEFLVRDESTRLAAAKRAQARALRLGADAMARRYYEIYADLLMPERRAVGGARGAHRRGRAARESVY